MEKIKIASRSSSLALKQTEIVSKSLKNFFDIEIVKISTAGDKFLHKPVAEIGGKGLFVKELERSLLNGDAHIAVHSLKDMETNIAKDTFIGAIYSRDSRNDVLLGKYKSLSDLPQNAIIGTSSPRRKAFLKYFRNDFIVKLCRGNIETRISKLNQNKYDALILAEAGLNRLNINYSYKIPTKVMPPSAGQGAIAIQCLNKIKNKHINKIIFSLNDQKAFVETQAERSFIKTINGNCYSPISVSANVLENKSLFLEAHIINKNGTEMITDKIEGNKANAITIGESLAKKLIKKGAKKLLEL
tara:strand:- start:241 stop:1143 length:903 start_codon:yes stop_codon:yes gene_type:complete